MGMKRVAAGLQRALGYSKFARRLRAARAGLASKTSEEGVVRDVAGIVGRRWAPTPPVVIFSRLWNIRDGQRECRVALLELAAKAKALNDAGSGSQLRLALERAEGALTNAYRRDLRISLQS